MNPSREQYYSLEEAYDIFNQRLFNGILPPCLISLQREKRSYGYFHFRAFEGKNGHKDTYTDEIALNPNYFSRDDREVLSTLAHEQCHLWQFHFGNHSRAGYHNREWAIKMIEIGLQPTSTGEPGGKITGQKMTHYIIPGGRFDKVVEQILATGARIHWMSRGAADPEKPKKKGKSGKRTKYTCPVCGLNAWAKSGANIRCGDCKVPLEAV